MRHPDLLDFNLDYGTLGPAATWAKSAIGQKVIEDGILATEPFCAVLGAIEAAPSRPPHPALDRYMLPILGLGCLDDMVKTATGRVVKQAIQHVGGQHTAKGIAIIVASAFANGSSYALAHTVRGHLNHAQRLAWLEKRVAELEKQDHDKAA